MDLKQLAIDIAESKVFGSWMVSEKDINDLSIIFLPLGLGAGKELGDVYAFYQYFSEALGGYQLGKSEGYPCFSSVKYLTLEQGKQLEEEVKKYSVLKEGFMK